jgi:TRAP-type C4-dicarboxylate transport system substrate-binding protein
MKKTIIIIVALLMLGILAIAGCAEETEPTSTSTSAPAATSTTEPAKPIELRMSWMETDNPLYNASHGKFVDAVQERSGGRLKITEFFAGQLVPPPETYDAAVKGTHDIGIGWVGMNPERFKNIEVVTLTRLDADYGAVNAATNELYQTTPAIQAEFADTHLLALSNSGNSGLGCRDDAIRTKEDMQGLKIHIVSRFEARLIELLGGAPMSMMPNEIYTALQRKVIDSGSFEPEMLYAYNLQEILKYWTKVSTMTNVIYTVMNKDKWNSLPADLQKILQDAALEFIPTGYRNHFLDESPLDVAAKDYGLTVIELSPDELARWQEIQDQVRAEWVDEMESEGRDGQQILEAWDGLCEKYSTE